jgi:hypothetical protein
MGALFLLYIVGFIWSLYMLIDGDNKNKDSIISSEIIIMAVPYFLLGVKLSSLYWADKVSGFFVLGSIILFTSVVVFLLTTYNKKRFKKIDELIEYQQQLIIQHNRNIELIKMQYEKEYFDALKNGDKAGALNCGRRYYHYIGIYNEQRIQNDLLCYLQPQNK